MIVQSPVATPTTTLLDHVEQLRIDVSRRLDPGRRTELGQFLTPAPVARLMASMFSAQRPSLRILDAGAGVGSLSAALVAELCGRSIRPRLLALTAYEIDPLVGASLPETLALCRAASERAGVCFTGLPLDEDFIAAGTDMLRGGLFARDRPAFDCAILNPPYRKIAGDSRARHLLRGIGIETSNLYTAFMALVVRLLAPGGELVAITPRSFCNGPYFKPFRAEFLQTMRIRRLHLFESRSDAFRDDDVLQENLILHAVKGGGQERVIISTSSGSDEDAIGWREAEYDQVVQPSDPDLFIHVVADDLGNDIVARIRRFSAHLSEIGLSISTGRVVDFRAASFLRGDPGEDTAPLIYPAHFDNGFIAWPKPGKKPNAIARSEATRDLLVPPGIYVLVKRFSAKEERRRVVAAIYDPNQVDLGDVGFENHVNYYHQGGAGLPAPLAKGLAAFLNSTLVDAYFRQFNGHTQVNAADLRRLRYPSREDLARLGAHIGDVFPDQYVLDRLIDEELLPMQETGGRNPVLARQKIEQALAILKDLGLPRAQQNERSALTLLALLDLRPESAWADARNPLRGITPLMEFFAQHYGKTYAPNTRETVRRFTMHQFVQAGIALANPDQPQRPTNSPKAVYQIEATTLDLLRTYGTPRWDRTLRIYLSALETLRERHAQYRVMQRIPVSLADGTTFTLSPGGQNLLIAPIIQEFCERFTPGGLLLYVGDTSDKFAHFDRHGLESLGITIEAHGKMPDVIIYHQVKNWLVLVEAVTSHGPVNVKRRDELRALFKGSTAPLVFVTAFLSRRAMIEYLSDIAWETEVWVADAPDHMIHFNGERFLGPYEQP